jgi:hypothetical protein
MGNADPTVNGGAVGEPLLGAGFYDPAAANYRDDNSPVRLIRGNPTDPSTFRYPLPTDPAIPPNIHYNPADPPQSLTRAKQPGAPPVGAPGSGWATDNQFIQAASWEDFRDLMYGDEQGTSMVGAHGAAHGYIGGDLGDPHISFRDPFVFFLHSNIDRLWAMWQRQLGHRERLDPAQVYHTEENSTTIAGRNDVEVGEPYWGIQLPLAPWAGFAAQTQMKDVWPVRPWAAAPAGQPPEDEENLPGNNKNSTDPTVVIPPSYDTAVHSMYIIVNRDTFSSAEVSAKGTPAIFPAAFYVVCDGFEPQELGVTTPGPPLPQPPAASLPTFTYGGANSIRAVNPTALYEDPSGAIDMPQRIMIQYDLKFTGTGDFPSITGGENFFDLRASLTYQVDTGTGGTVVNQSVVASSELALVNQPNPYMDKINPTLSPPNPYWLSIDTRVFQIKGPRWRESGGITCNRSYYGDARRHGHSRGCPVHLHYRCVVGLASQSLAVRQHYTLPDGRNSEPARVVSKGGSREHAKGVQLRVGAGSLPGTKRRGRCASHGRGGLLSGVQHCSVGTGLRCYQRNR